jgi:hypothetical protein
VSLTGSLAGEGCYSFGKRVLSVEVSFVSSKLLRILIIFDLNSMMTLIDFKTV